MKVKKKEAAFVIIAMLIAFTFFFFINSKKVLACSDPDNYTLRILDPNGVQIRNSSVTIEDVNGQVSPPCNNAQTGQANSSASCQIAGTYTADVVCPGCLGSGHTVASTNVLTCYAPEANKFVIRNNAGTAIAAFDEKGYLYLRGFNFSDLTGLSPPPDSFVVKRASGQVAAYINSSGSLFIDRFLTTDQATVSAPDDSFVIRNRTGNDVAYISDVGNLVLSGELYFNWTDPI